MSTPSITKRKRLSKKNKSAWRKTDIKDVEDYLEEQRQEERIGSVKDKKDEELFTVDVTPHKATKFTGLTPKQKRKLNAAKPLRSLAIFENTSKVQDPIAKRNHVKQKKSGRNLEEEVRNPTAPRHFQANKDRARYYEKLENKLKKDNTSLKTAKDVWVEEDFRDKIPGLKDEKGWISRDLALHVTKSIGKPVVKVHSSIRHRTTKAKNFEPPHPGMSYNPSIDDHQALLGEVIQREEKIIKEEKHLKRVTTDIYKKVTVEERDQLKYKELCGDSKIRTATDNNAENVPVAAADDDDGDGDGDEAEAPYKPVNVPVENKKKSKAARHKQLKQKELKKKQEAKKALKKQIADINRIKPLKAEVLAEEQELNELKKRRKKTALKKKFEPKRLGRNKYVEPDVDVNMAEDIPGNVRNIKTERSLLVDRFKSFQKRNIIPTTVHIGKQPLKKIKRFPRSSHKEIDISFDTLRQQRKTLGANKN